MFTITPLQESDLVNMFQEIQISHNHLEELGWILQSSWDRFYQHYRSIIDKKKLSIFAIRVDGNFAGAVEIADQKDHYAIGYWIGINYRGQGIATEAIKSVLNQFNDKPVFADTLLTNPKSSNILERLGFRLEKSTVTNNFYKLPKLEVDKV